MFVCIYVLTPSNAPNLKLFYRKYVIIPKQKYFKLVILSIKSNFFIGEIRDDGRLFFLVQL